MSKQTVDNTNYGFGWLKSMIEIIDEYGYVKTIVSIILTVFFSYAIYITFNPSVIFERYDKYSTEQHEKSFNYRMNMSPKVSDCLDKLLLETDGTRAFIIEMHNGKYNSSGLSFNFGSMTYESLADSVESIREDYYDFSLERFKIVYTVYNDGYWGGNVDELAKIDKRLSLRLVSNGVRRMYVTVLYGEEDEIGFLGVTYSGDSSNLSDSQIKTVLTKYSVKISPYLDGKNAR